jgi:hypothetical protein
MKITKQMLKEMIQEEVKRTVSEAADWRDELDAEMNGPTTQGLQLELISKTNAVIGTLRAIDERLALFHASLLDILENALRERE